MKLFASDTSWEKDKSAFFNGMTIGTSTTLQYKCQDGLYVLLFGCMCVCVWCLTCFLQFQETENLNLDWQKDEEELWVGKEHD